MSDGIHTLAFGHREIVAENIDIERNAKQIVLAFDEAVGLGVENLSGVEQRIQSHPGYDTVEATNAVRALTGKVYEVRRKDNARNLNEKALTEPSSKRLRVA